MAFKQASKNNQYRLQNLRNEFLPSYEESLTDEERRDCLKQVLFRIEDMLKNENDKWRKKDLGLLKFEIQEKMRSIRPSMKLKCSIESYFMEAARETLTKDLFSLILGKANRLLENNHPER